MSLDLDRAFTSELTRRAAAHLCDRLEAPSADPAGDDPLAALIAELAVRAADTHAPQAALESEALTLELTRLDREISATRRQRRRRPARRPPPGPPRPRDRAGDGADPAGRVIPVRRSCAHTSPLD